MTDAREIIASKLPFADAIKQQWAQEILDALHASGFRIIGKDEVDQVTVEKAAVAAEERAEWVPLKAGDMATAIRAIGRKA